MHARRTNTAQRDVGPDGHTTSASPADSGRVSATGIPPTIASNARSDGGASALTTAFDNACSTFDRFIPGTLPADLRPAPEPNSAPLRTPRQGKSVLVGIWLRARMRTPVRHRSTPGVAVLRPRLRTLSAPTLAGARSENCPAQALTGGHPSTAVSSLRQTTAKRTWHSNTDRPSGQVPHSDHQARVWFCSNNENNATTIRLEYLLYSNKPGNSAEYPIE